MLESYLIKMKHIESKAFMTPGITLLQSLRPQQAAWARASHCDNQKHHSRQHGPGHHTATIRNITADGIGPGHQTLI